MNRSHQRGFTLFELMMGVAILSVLVGLAIPSFRQFTANTRTTAATNGLVSALAVARSEALRQSMRVSVCASTNQATCNASPATNWTGGWIAFTDNTGNPGQLDGTDTLIQSWPSAGPTMTVTSDAASMQYDGRGMNSLTTKITFTIASAGCRGNHKSQVVVTATGSPQQSYIACP
jgi:type IV fimbrial biogenesis protein FimT